MKKLAIIFIFLLIFTLIACEDNPEDEKQAKFGAAEYDTSKFN